jgi:hypothetical protein
MTKKTAKPKSPDKLTKTGKKSGVELTESELGQARGGLIHKAGDTLK